MGSETIKRSMVNVIAILCIKLMLNILTDHSQTTRHFSYGQQMILIDFAVTWPNVMVTLTLSTENVYAEYLENTCDRQIS